MVLPVFSRDTQSSLPPMFPTQTLLGLATLLTADPDHHYTFVYKIPVLPIITSIWRE